MKYGLNELSRGKVWGSRQTRKRCSQVDAVTFRTPPRSSSRVLAVNDIREDARATRKERGEKGKLISFMIQIESSDKLPAIPASSKTINPVSQSKQHPTLFFAMPRRPRPRFRRRQLSTFLPPHQSESHLEQNSLRHQDTWT